MNFDDAVEIRRVLINILLSLGGDERTDIVFRRLIAESLDALADHLGYRFGLHLSGLLSAEDELTCHALVLDGSPEGREYLSEALIYRNDRDSMEDDEGWMEGLPALRKWPSDSPDADANARENLLTIAHADGVFPARPKKIAGEKLKRLLRCFGVDADDDKGAIVVALDQTEKERFPFGQMGVFVLWGRRPDVAHTSWPRTGSMMVREIAKALKRTMRERFQISDDTYFPTHREVGKKSAAMLYADMRNFTPTTETFQNLGLQEEWRKFLKEFFNILGSAIHKEGGYVQGFGGDAMLAVFEQGALPREELVARVVRVAENMYRQFWDLKEEFVHGDVVNRLKRDVYMPVDAFDLGIGIHWGEVICGYFGGKGAQVYCAFGDNINFTQRLQTAARKPRSVPISKSEARKLSLDPANVAPILVSRPVWQALKDTDVGAKYKERSLDLEVKGKPQTYEVYEIEPKLKA